MGELLIAHWLFELSTWEWVIDPGAWLVIFEVALGLGMIIFVHELGHFAVAKLCGVKCEKFYLGFDIAGYKFCKFQWGETEYGIGVLPLGGYVKMLGQEDNPARLREELERAKAARAAGEAPPEPADGDEPIDIAAAEAALYDPRSYLAQSVPKRMAIISAGVIMNLIFAFIAAAAAYGLGVEKIVCSVGATQPGSPAWAAGIKVGDDILAINDHPVREFDDLRMAISLSNRGEEVTVRVRREGVAEDQVFTMHPDRSGLLAMIGVGSSNFLTLQTNPKIEPCIPNMPAAAAEPKFERGDRIVKIGDVPVKTYADLRREFARNPEKSLLITVQRDHTESYEEDGREKTKTITEEVTSRMAPRPVKWLGLVMEMGPVSSVQEGSPAALAGLKPGDRIKTINGESPGNPIALPESIRKMAGQDVEIVVQRDDTEHSVKIHVEQPDDYCTVMQSGGDMGIPALGIAYPVLNKVASVNPGSPADEAGLKAGDVLDKITLTPPDRELLKERGLKPSDYREQSYDLTEGKNCWPFIFEQIQMLPPDAKITLVRAGKDVTLEPVVAADWFHPERGFRYEPRSFIEQAHGIGSAVALGAEETWDAATKVLTLLEKLRTGEISPKVLGGPVMIANAAGYAASAGLSKFLLFLTLLSANLAVINFLPIPVLDGGHMVFLAWEGIRGKPVDERVQLVLSYIGLLLILTLMVWVFALDFKWIPRE
ncbi:MAG: site-2 protease family protein [Pirellulales bacterium]|nr:site-2 protease family protein [Pirellulales bacterium]